MEPPEVDFGKIIGTLLSHDVKFVLIGGLAALAQGSPFPTEDVDVTPRQAPRTSTNCRLPCGRLARESGRTGSRAGSPSTTTVSRSPPLACGT